MIPLQPGFRATAPTFTPLTQILAAHPSSTEQREHAPSVNPNMAVTKTNSQASGVSEGVRSQSYMLESIAEESGVDILTELSGGRLNGVPNHNRGKSDAYYPEWLQDRTTKWVGPARPRSRTEAFTTAPLRAAAHSASSPSLVSMAPSLHEKDEVLNSHSTRVTEQIQSHANLDQSEGFASSNSRLRAPSESGKSIHCRNPVESRVQQLSSSPMAAQGATRTGTAVKAVGDADCERCNSIPSHFFIPCHHTSCDQHMSRCGSGLGLGELSQLNCATCGVEIDNIVALREEYAEVDSRIRGSHSNLPHGLLHDSDNDMARFQHSPVRPVQTALTGSWEQHSAKPSQVRGSQTNGGSASFPIEDRAQRASGPMRSGEEPNHYISASERSTHFLDDGRPQLRISQLPPRSFPQPGSFSRGGELQPNHPHTALNPPHAHPNQPVNSPYLPQLQYLAGDLLRADSRTSSASWSTQISHAVPVSQANGFGSASSIPYPVNESALENMRKDDAQQAQRAQASLLARAIREGRAEPESMLDPRQQAGRQAGVPPFSSQGAGGSVPYSHNSMNAPSAPSGTASVALQRLICNGRPSVEEAFEHIPFVERARFTKPVGWGVIKIMNIPYGTTKQEVVAFVGRNARLVQQPQGSPYFAIHIIMERSTAKTMDCFVEFETQNEALHAVSRFQRQCMSARHPRIGDRHVEVELSGQDVLMKDLFPRAKCVKWDGQHPIVYATDEPFNSGFKGFITSEEVVMTVKHAETPQRSPFSHKCLQRTYESVISTLAKYPWWAVNNYTLGERDMLFNATRSLISALVNQMRRGSNSPQLNEQLLQELVGAGLNAPGFSERQKAALLEAADDSRLAPGTLSPWATSWPFEVLSPKDGVELDVLHFYICLLCEAKTSVGHQSLADRSSRAFAAPSSSFGDLMIHWPAEKDALTVEQAARIEWNAVESLLRSVLPDKSGS